jgi:hypothetical protein
VRRQHRGTEREGSEGKGAKRGWSGITVKKRRNKQRRKETRRKEKNAPYALSMPSTPSGDPNPMEGVQQGGAEEWEGEGRKEKEKKRKEEKGRCHTHHRRSAPDEYLR